MLPDLAISGAEGWLIVLTPYALLALVFALVQLARGVKVGEQDGAVTLGAGSRGHARASEAVVRPRTAAGLTEGRLENSVAARSHLGGITAGRFSSSGAVGATGGADVKGFAPPFAFKPGRLVPPSARGNGATAVADVPDVAELESEARHSDIEAIEAEIQDALRAKDQAALGDLYLRHGAALRIKGETRKAGDVVRKSVMIAMQLKDARLHALGRIELGDIASELGDLTTACEHWQMAKRMFLEIKHRSDTDAADERMLSHGCPTEWVLNDF